MPKKVYDLLGINAISEIENDPYILIDIARGVEFSQIDKMAIELGIERENQKKSEKWNKICFDENHI